jgi:hypothetical protein
MQKYLEVQVGDIVLLSHPAPHLSPPKDCLGAFGLVLLHVFTHELLAGYRFNLVSQPDLDCTHLPTEDFCRLSKCALLVNSFRASHALAFLAHGKEDEEDEDERYFSDGI